VSGLGAVVAADELILYPTLDCYHHQKTNKKDVSRCYRYIIYNYTQMNLIFSYDFYVICFCIYFYNMRFGSSKKYESEKDIINL
jgi:hypothetical protein